MSMMTTIFNNVKKDATQIPPIFLVICKLKAKICKKIAGSFQKFVVNFQQEIAGKMHEHSRKFPECSMNVQEKFREHSEKLRESYGIITGSEEKVLRWLNCEKTFALRGCQQKILKSLSAIWLLIFLPPSSQRYVKKEKVTRWMPHID